MKRKILITLAILFVFTLVGCASKTEAVDDTFSIPDFTPQEMEDKGDNMIIGDVGPVDWDTSLEQSQIIMDEAVPKWEGDSEVVPSVDGWAVYSVMHNGKAYPVIAPDNSVIDGNGYVSHVGTNILDFLYWENVWDAQIDFYCELVDEFDGNDEALGAEPNVHMIEGDSHIHIWNNMIGGRFIYRYKDGTILRVNFEGDADSYGLIMRAGETLASQYNVKLPEAAG